jgi:hypothetical protein
MAKRNACKMRIQYDCTNTYESPCRFLEASPNAIGCKWASTDEHWSSFYCASKTAQAAARKGRTKR